MSVRNGRNVQNDQSVRNAKTGLTGKNAATAQRVRAAMSVRRRTLGAENRRQENILQAEIRRKASQTKRGRFGTQPNNWTRLSFKRFSNTRSKRAQRSD